MRRLWLMVPAAALAAIVFTQKLQDSGLAREVTRFISLGFGVFLVADAGHDAWHGAGPVWGMLARSALGAFLVVFRLVSFGLL